MAIKLERPNERGDAAAGTQGDLRDEGPATGLPVRSDRDGAHKARGAGEGAAPKPVADAAGRAPVDRRGRNLPVLTLVVLLLLLAALVLPSGWFSPNMASRTLAQWMLELQHRVAGLVSLVTLQGGDYSMDFVTWRYLVVALAGAGLGLSGAVFQGSLKNALASPSTLGVMTGCNLGRILYVLVFAGLGSTVSLSGLSMSEVGEAIAGMGPLEYLWRSYGMALCALACGTVVVVLVVGISTVAGRGRVSNLVMVIVGQVISSVIGAVVGLAQYCFTVTGDPRAETLRTLQIQSFANTFRSVDVLLVGIPVLIVLAIVMWQATRLNAISLGAAEARTMGIEARRTQWVTVIACTALTGVIVAFCGQVGMVGFMIPHLTRRIVGPDLRYLVPASALMGAGFLVAAYFCTTLIETDTSTSLGVYTSLLGGVVFLVVALRQRGRSRGDWM